MITEAETGCCPNCGSMELRPLTKYVEPWVYCEGCHQKHRTSTCCPTPSEIARVGNLIKTGVIVADQSK